ncbi:50S ribosomal protein L18e [Candidatus Woesearchaeota archaeon]|nr:50S ribosomal protein L18e [Candidatus Woesearchaeota archaeon]
MKRTGPTNENLQMLIAELRQKSLAEGVKLWKRIAKDLEKPSRQRRSVNIYKIEQFAKDGETVVVPGKVLSLGQLTKKLNVAAWTFSKEAEQKINKVGKTITIQQLIKENPKGKKVRILG